MILSKKQSETNIPGLLLNLLEMWACVLFQTLPKKALEVYLPQDTPQCYSQEHLNIALPVCQNLTENYQEEIRNRELMYHSSDPDIQQHLKALRQKFFDLKNSEDATLREYFLSVNRKIRAQGAAAKKEKTRQKALSGMNRLICQAVNGHRWVTISHFQFRISKSLDFLQAGMEVRVQCCLLPGQHPHAYAIDALHFDPAIRLGVKVIGKDHEFEAWLSAKGTQTVKQVNRYFRGDSR